MPLLLLAFSEAGQTPGQSHLLQFCPPVPGCVNTEAKGPLYGPHAEETTALQGEQDHVGTRVQTPSPRGGSQCASLFRLALLITLLHPTEGSGNVLYPSSFLSPSACGRHQEIRPRQVRVLTLTTAPSYWTTVAWQHLWVPPTPQMLRDLLWLTAREVKGI